MIVFVDIQPCAPRQSKCGDFAQALAETARESAASVSRREAQHGFFLFRVHDADSALLKEAVEQGVGWQWVSIAVSVAAAGSW